MLSNYLRTLKSNTHPAGGIFIYDIVKKIAQLFIRDSYNGCTSHLGPMLGCYLEAAPI